MHLANIGRNPFQQQTMCSFVRVLRLAVPLCFLASGCGGSSGKRVSFDVRLEGVGANSQQSTASEPYAVTLTKAHIHMGTVTFYAGEPLFARVLRQLTPIALAHAHPGHYQEGDALAQLIQTRVVDLLGEPLTLGRAEGVTGEYRSASVELVGSTTADATVELMGTATHGDTEVAFSGAVDLAQVVAGVAADDAIASGEGHVAVQVDLARWVAQIDFTAFSGSGQHTIEPDTQAYNALVRGITATESFGVAWEPVATQ